MEEDRNYNDFLTGFQFKYGYLESESEKIHSLNIYNGRGPCLRFGDAKRFETRMGYLEVCGRMAKDFFKCITAESNQCEHPRIHMSDEGVFGGSNWNSISVEEMVHFQEIALKMSAGNRELR